MSIKNDLKYPFGNPVVDMFSERMLTALSNTLNLAKERIWLAEGKPIALENSDFDEFIDLNLIPHAKTSISEVDDLLLDIQKTLSNLK
jgi:hypothetical protein